MDTQLQPTKPIAPDEFARRMKELAESYDTEEAHGEADAMMCALLIALGYGEGVEAFIAMKKWYA